MPEPEPPTHVQIAWRDAQQESNQPAAVAPTTNWHPLAREQEESGRAMVASNWRTARAASDSTDNVIPANLQPPQGAQAPPATCPAELRRTSDISPPSESPVPGPQSLMVVPEQAVAGPIPHEVIGHDTHKVPFELAKMSLPPYIVEPPDILLVETIKDLTPKQPVTGQHLVRPDGTIGLGIYGPVRVAGMTLEQIRVAVVNALNAAYPNRQGGPIKPEDVNVDVLAYNSKVYYIITDGGGFGEQVYRQPITGNETVLDAISLINGLPPVASKKKIWVARRVPDQHHGGFYNNILPVDWCAITKGGATSSNYQILPGDRIYVAAEKIIHVDSAISKFVSPIERLLGVTLLGSETVNSIRNRGTGTGTLGR
jgi:polysaccharide export outer membrane protein